MSETPDSYADCLIKLGEAIKENEALSERLKAENERHTEAQRMLRTKISDFNNVKRQHDNALRDIAELKDELVKRNQECNTYRDQSTELAEANAKLQALVTRLEGQVQNLESNLSRQQGENNSLKTEKTHLEVANTDLKNRCGRLRKDANRARDISASESTMTIGEIAAFRSISAVRMNRFLQTHGLISKTNNTWVPSANAMEMGLARMTAVTYRRKDRTKKATKNFLRWTEKGREHILHLYDTHRVEAQSA